MNPTGLRERLRIGEGLRRLGGTGDGGVRGFLSWWGRALLAWLPMRWRSAVGFERGRLLLQPDRNGIQLRIEDTDGLRDIARLPALGAEASATATLLSLLPAAVRDLPRWLLLPASVALRRQLTLPAAASERLRDVVGFEIDRQTPFGKDDVAFDARTLARGEKDGQVHAELVAVPRAAMQSAEAAIGDLSGTLAGIDVLASEGAPLGVNLLAPEQRRTQADPLRGWNLVLAAVAVLATAAMLWQLLDNRRQAAEAFEQSARKQIAAARQVSTQRQQVVDLVAGQAFLDAQRSGQPTTVEVIDDISRRIPDGTYLEKLAIEGGRVTLIGRSNDASSLVGALEGSTMLRAPALTGALQPDPRTGRDIFTLVADLAAAPQAKEAGSAPAR